MTERKSNYDVMRADAEARFLGYDQEHMIKKFHLESDQNYIYLRFVGRKYRIDRHTGRIEWSEEAFTTAKAAGFNETLSIFDVLCNSREGCYLCGRFNQIGRMKAVRYAAAPGTGLYTAEAAFFDKEPELLAKACEILGGKKESPGDVAYRLNTFDFLPVILQFWASDEEFPAALKIMWDENTLDFIRFETSFYVLGHLLGRIREEMERLK